MHVLLRPRVLSSDEGPRSHDWQRGWGLLPVFLAGIVSTQAQAATMSGEAIETLLRYKSEELTSPVAARVLLKRIGEAALESCGASPFSLAEYKAATKQTRCWQTAVKGAVRRINSPVLDAVADRARQ